MLVILLHGLLAMTVSKLHVRNVEFMTLTPFLRRKCMEISS
jgi:hypothetical protein